MSPGPLDNPVTPLREVIEHLWQAYWVTDSARTWVEIAAREGGVPSDDLPDVLWLKDVVARLGRAAQHLEVVEHES